MGGKGGGGPSAGQMMQMQRTLQREAFNMQQQATLDAEARDAVRREDERKAELERRRLAEVEKAKKAMEEELREDQIFAESDKPKTNTDSIVNLNLDSPQIEAPDYAPREELK